MHVEQRPADERSSTTRLIATEALPAPIAQRSPIPAAALALTAAATVGCVSLWLHKRWQAVREDKREHEQRQAVKKDILARQKQRFQRALVVDSVNLELPPIKDMDVQPGPVRVEKIISQQAPSSRKPSTSSHRGGAMPGLAGESLRQWQQFMAASRATEVTDVSKNRGRGAAEQSGDRPYVALDDRMLADLSERIRRANDATAAGGASAPMPVITFEQLYANNHESDDEAMARRAAERKARWQKQQQPGTNAGTGSGQRTSTTRPGIPDRKDSPTVKGSTRGSSRADPAAKQDSILASVSIARPKAPRPDNPFAVGLFPPATEADDTDNSGGSSHTATSTAGSPSRKSPPPIVPRLDLSSLGVGADSSPGGQSRPRDANPFAVGFAKDSPAGAETDANGISQATTSSAAGSPAKQPAPLMVPRLDLSSLSKDASPGGRSRPSEATPLAASTPKINGVLATAVAEVNDSLNQASTTPAAAAPMTRPTPPAVPRLDLSGVGAGKEAGAGGRTRLHAVKPFKAVASMPSKGVLTSSTADPSNSPSRASAGLAAVAATTQPGSPVVPKLDLSNLAAGTDGSPGGRARLHIAEPAQDSLLQRAVPSTGGSGASLPARIVHAQGAESVSKPSGLRPAQANATGREARGAVAEATHGAMACAESLRDLRATAAADSIQIGAEVVEGVRRRSASPVLQELDAVGVAALQAAQVDSVVTAPIRVVKRAPAAGPLRTPDKQSPVLARLMRRPSAGVAMAERTRSMTQEPQLAVQ